MKSTALKTIVVVLLIIIAIPFFNWFLNSINYDIYWFTKLSSLSTALAAFGGHENWGKSFTLKKFAGSAHKHWIEINDKFFYVKHMSNDDISGELFDWVKDFIKKHRDKDYGLIFALCPDFENLEKKTTKILELLAEFKIIIKFFVLDKNYNSKKPISHSEINQLKKYGTTYSVDGSSEDINRANKLLQFIKNNI